MDEPYTPPVAPLVTPDPPLGSSAAPHIEDPVRRSVLRRLMALVVAGSVAFALTTWTLVRVQSPLSRLEFVSGSGPSGVVKAHLEALNRGELRAAYQLFSSEYRRQVSFEAYQRLVLTHVRMFRARDYQLARVNESAERAVLESHILAENGERYLARFTLVRAEGRWWIDDLRWGSEARAKGLLSV